VAPRHGEDVVSVRVACYHFMLRARHFVSCSTAAGRLYGAYGTFCSRLTILVPLVFSGGLGSCTSSKTQQPPIQAAFVFLAIRIENR
jgi:hypothetical protein